MEAVIWTDVVQMFLYVGGAIVSLFVIVQQIPEGWSHIWQVADQAGKLRVFDFRFDLSTEFFTRPYSFWAGVIGGCFLTTASHGTEQLMVQRLLSARTQEESRLALFGSWFVIFFQFALFLTIGMILYVFYRDTGRPAPAIPDRIYPEFIWEFLPPGVAGLVMAAILAAAMSNLSAALNALASTTVMDFWKPLARKERTESEYLRIARWVTVFWGGVLLVIAFLARSVQSVLEYGLGIASIVYGALLGTFLLGVLTRRVGERAAMCGMAAGLALNIYIKFGTTVAWTWYVLIGTAATFITAWIASFILPRENTQNV
jgi:SSS family transporter